MSGRSLLSPIFTLLCPILFATSPAAAQEPAASPAPPEPGRWIAAPGYASLGKAVPRQEFISYAVRSHAEQRDLDKNDHYLPLEGKWRIHRSTVQDGGVAGFYRPGFSVAAWDQTDVPNLRPAANAAPLDGLQPPVLPAGVPLVQYRAEIDVPYLWLDRNVYLHVEGVGGAYSLYVNGSRIGYSDDSRTPAEYLLSEVLTDGLNAICIEVYGYSQGSWMESLLVSREPGTLGRLYVYSQPKLCIHDFTITTQLDSAGHNGIFWVTVVMSNSYRSDEPITLGYDVYAPGGGKLLTYNLQETEVPAEGYDTIVYKEYIFKSVRKMWSPQSPNLYEVMFYTRRDGRITEYIPFRVGFNRTEVREGVLYANDKPIDISAADYNAASDSKTTEQQLRALKSRGINTLCVGYPQPRWFYELCDRVGFYVIDQANNNPGYRPDDRNLGGSLSNTPAYLPHYLDRVAQMRGRTNGYTSVSAISMGGRGGNGYNLYKSYQWLKGADSIHPVTYRDIRGEWNADFAFPDARDAQALLRQAAPPKPAARRR